MCSSGHTDQSTLLSHVYETIYSSYINLFLVLFIVGGQRAAMCCAFRTSFKASSLMKRDMVIEKSPAYLYGWELFLAWQHPVSMCRRNASKIYIAGADEHVMTGRPFSPSLPASLSCFMQTGRNLRRAALIKCCFVGGISGGGSAHSIWLFIQSYSQYIHTAAAPTTPALPIPFYRKMSLTFFKNKSCETCSFTDSESKCYFFTLNHPVFRGIKLYLAFYIHPSCQEMALITSIIIPWIFIAFDKWLIMYSGMTV